MVNLDIIVIGMAIGFALGTILFLVLRMAFYFTCFAILETIQYIECQRWLYKRNKHRRKCGLPKLNKQ